MALASKPAPSSQSLSGLARRLVQENILSEKDAQEASLAAQKKRVSFVSYLIENKLAERLSVAVVAAMEYGVPLFDLA